LAAETFAALDALLEFTPWAGLPVTRGDPLDEITTTATTIATSGAMPSATREAPRLRVLR
jgi:hypothetical protein